MPAFFLTACRFFQFSLSFASSRFEKPARPGYFYQQARHQKKRRFGHYSIRAGILSRR